MINNIIDLHTHSVLSKHAYSSVSENIDEAIKKKMKVLGISEHQPDGYGVGVHRFAIANLSAIPSKIGDLNILKGIELNILDDGQLDLSEVSLNKIDYAIVSMHRYARPVNADVEANTTAYINALKHDFVKIVGHMDRDGYPCDYEEVIKACAIERKIIELNNSSFRWANSEAIIKRDLVILNCCKKYNVPVIINSDAHIRYDVGNFANAWKVVEKANFPHTLIVNCNTALIKEYFNIDIDL